MIQNIVIIKSLRLDPHLDMVRCAIWHQKREKHPWRSVRLLVNLQALACNFNKIDTPPWVFSRFLNCTNGTKSRNAPQYAVLPYKLTP